MLKNAIAKYYFCFKEKLIKNTKHKQNFDSAFSKYFVVYLSYYGYGIMACCVQNLAGVHRSSDCMAITIHSLYAWYPSTPAYTPHSIYQTLAKWVKSL